MKFSIFILALFTTVCVNAQMAINVTSANNGQTFSTCNGFVIDSGGQGGPGYSNGEDVTITICPDTPGDYISIVFNLFDLNLTDDNPAPNQTNVDYMYVYDGTSTSANSLGVYQGNQLQGVVIQATPQNPTGCITFRFVSNSAGTGMFSASATCETPCNDPVAAGQVMGGFTTDSIHVCVGELVDFQDMGSYAQPGFSLVDYSWDFMDGETANGQNVTHTYDIPGHYRVQLFVTDDNGCTNNNLTDIQVLVATIPSFIGFHGDTSLCLGESLAVHSTPNDYEVLWDGFTGYETIDNGCLPDTLLGVAQEIDILQTGFAAGTTITDISQIQSVCLELEHSYMGDLVIYLTCPNGQSVMLHQQGGGGTQIGIPNQLDNVDCSDPTTQGTPFNYCFTPSATQTWVDWVNASGGFGGGTLPAGDYEPVQSLTNLVGCPTNGVWTLTVVDNWAADDGTLFSFGLTLDPSLYPNLVQFTPQIGLGADSSYWTFPAPYASGLTPDGDGMLINPTAPGQFTYTYTVVDDFGCTHDSTFVLTVTDNPLPFAGNDIIACSGTPVQLDASINGTGTGSPCPYTIDLHDTFGDSWNGNNLLVTINGVTNTYTVPTGSDAVYTLNIAHGASVTVQFQSSGGWPNECQYHVYDPEGNTVVQGGTNGSAPSTTPHTFTADCFSSFVFSWSPSNYLNNPNIPDPTGNFQSPQTLTLTVYPEGHPLCATTDEINVTLSVSAYPGHDSTLTICSNGAPADLFPLLGPGASTYGSWFGPNNAAVLMPYDPLTMNPGIYTYKVDSGGCVSQAKVVVTEINTAITSLAVSDVTCNSGNDGTITITGTSFSSYSVNGGPAMNGTSPVTIPGLETGAYTIEVFGIQGCHDSSSTQVLQPDPLEITFLSNDTIICMGASATLTVVGAGGSSPYGYSWTENGSPFAQEQTITVTPPLAENTYCVTLSEACGSPTVTECMTISNPEPIIPVLTPDTTNGCYPVTVYFSNTTNSTEIALTQVDFGDGAVQTYLANEGFSHTYTHPGIYTVNVTITSIYGCVYTATFEDMIQAFDYPVANFTILPNNVSFFDPVVQLIDESSSDVVSWEWLIPNGDPATSGQQNLTATYPLDQENTYPVTLIVTDAHQCRDTISKDVNVISEVLFYAPNSFTPDGDEFNQTWNIVISGVDTYQTELNIYNRWGELIWKNNDPAIGWDGTYNGQRVPTGAYTWTLETRDKNSDKKYTFSGHVNVLW